jgi:CBS domain-containing protein
MDTNYRTRVVRAATAACGGSSGTGGIAILGRATAGRATPDRRSVMKVSEMMSADVCVVAPDDSLQNAARLMAEKDIGSLPVGEGDRLVGFLTDRDIVVRAVAGGIGPDASVREAMSTDVKYCFDDENIGHVARNMAELEVRRLPVVNRDKRLVGMVSLANFAQSGNSRASRNLLEGVARPH